MFEYVFSAVQAVGRWTPENRAWLHATHVCTKLRTITLENPHLWADVVPQLPRAAATLTERAQPLGAVLRVNQQVPKLPHSQTTGTFRDRARLACLLRGVSAKQVASIDFTEDRMPIPQVVAWIDRGAGWTNTLPKLKTFRIHAPAQFLDDEKDVHNA